MSTKTGIAPIAPATQSLVDRVTQAVRQSILQGRLRPGETLSISDLAADLGVSHSPVREALQRLSGQSLVVLRPARTAIVAPLLLDDLREIYYLRRLIEVDAVGRAAPKLKDDQLATLDREFEAMANADHASEAFWDSHNAFHLALMGSELTPRLERTVSELWHAGERYIRIVYMATDVLFTHSPRDRHLPLLEAAHSRKAAGMRKALTEHLQNNEREIAKSLRETVLNEPKVPRPAAASLDDY